ncbi:MAG: hypothetical protein HPY64_16565 [Anaerolineae bacterium]|nr:hypothetical protein [Anaerolineae bacterium]
MFRRNLILVGLLLGSLSQLGFSGLQQQATSDQLGFWLILFIAAVVLVVLLWWALRGSARSAQGYRPGASQVEEAAHPAEPVAAAAEAQAIEAAVAPEPPAATEPAPAEAAPVAVSEAAAPAAPDDLRRIEGIGPKVDAALRAMGITTFAQLAATDPDRLEADLRATGVHILPGAPKTWPEQAALAAKGDWEGFEKLTSQLKGGRRRE